MVDCEEHADNGDGFKLFNEPENLPDAAANNLNDNAFNKKEHVNVPDQ